MNIFRYLVSWSKQYPWIAEILASLALLAYCIQSWVYAHSRDSILDEGLYLLKGYLFLTGKYEPYQEYGVETNHMPLSFLIPGFFQFAFGPGLRTGRYYAIMISLLFFFGSWLLSRRLGGRWWSVFVTTTLAITPMMIKEFSIAVSQGLVACLLVWSLYFSFGENRRSWQLFLGAFLAGVLLMTRINMFAVLPFLVLYIFWNYGFKVGIFSTIIGLIPVLWGHITYYPGIMILWAKWLPSGLTPFLSSWRFMGMNQIPDPGITTFIRMKGFFQGLSLHLFPWVGVAVSCLLLPQVGKRKSKGDAYFLLSLFVFMFFLHTWATLGGTHCIFCFSWYQYFFEILAILILVVIINTWRFKLSRFQEGIFWGMVICLIIALALSCAYGLNTSFPAALAQLSNNLIDLPVPRFENGWFQPGQIQMWGLIANKLGMSSRHTYHQAYQIVNNWILAFLVFSFAGISFGLFLWIAGRLRKGEALERFFGIKADRTSLVILLLLLFAWMLTPFGFWGSTSDDYDCSYDIIKTYERAGKQLSGEIQPGEKVFWWGGDTQSVLLYLQDVDFYPALFNSDFSKREGNAAVLETHGLWNDELFQKWAQDSDIFLVESRFFTGWLKDYLTTTKFNELGPTDEIGCRGGTSLHVYIREP